MAARTSGSMVEADEEENEAEVVEEFDADSDDDEIADEEKNGAAPLRREGLRNAEAGRCLVPLMLMLSALTRDGVLGTW